MPKKPKGAAGSAGKGNSNRKQSQSPSKTMGAQSASDLNVASMNAREARARRFSGFKDKEKSMYQKE